MKKTDKKHLTQHKNGFIYYQRMYKGERLSISLQTKDWYEARMLRDQYNYELQKYGRIIFEEDEQETIIPVILTALYRMV